MEGKGIRARGLICAGGEATRLQELTRITNKHLLPVGRWPMVYYPLQLLERLGIRDVLLVTGQGHAGDFIDLLGDGRVREREGDELLFDLDLTYKVQTEPGGIAQVVGMAESFAGGEKPRRLPRATTSSSTSRPRRCAPGPRAPGEALIFVKEVPDPERFGVVVYGEDGRVADVVEKAGVVDLRYDAPAVERRRRRPLLLPAGRLRDHPRPRAVLARRARDHGRQPLVRRAGAARARAR